jgi:16S rRNA (guanine966-N2)-methyltransferase
MVENDRIALAALEQSRSALGATAVTIVAADALAFLAHDSGRFDVVFLDPPFRQNLLPDVLSRLGSRLVPGARVYVEAAAPVPQDGPWRELRRKRAGQVSYQLLEYTDDRSGLPRDV